MNGRGNSMYNPYTLKGKRILVTGASSGIGRSIAIECSKNSAQLIITGRNEVKLSSTLKNLTGDNHIVIPADLTSEEDIKNLIADLPLIDGVVLCAGIGESSLIQFCTLKKFRKVFDINFFSQVELIRQLIKRKKIDNKSSVVAIASISAYSYELGNSIYGSGKAALISWIKYAASEYGSKGIRFNCISPGMIETPLIRGGAFTDDQLESNKSQYVLGRFGRPEEVAYGVMYLLSDAAAWITGIDLQINGGHKLK